MTSANPDTKSHILNVAEKHFGMYGYAGTSLRGIIKEAQVNVAAVAYHFGSKDDLFAAVTDRFARPVVECQLSALRVVMNHDVLKIEEVLRAFYEPPISLVKRLGANGESLSLFLARCHTEPEPIFSLVDRHYAACRDEFVHAFRIVLPHLSEADYHWRFELMLGLIVTFLTRHNNIRRRYSKSAHWEVDDVVEYLIAFCATGMASEKQSGII